MVHTACSYIYIGQIVLAKHAADRSTDDIFR